MYSTVVATCARTLRPWLILLLGFSLAGPAQAQSPVRLIGHITIEGAPLSNVWVRGLPGGVITDEFGRFIAEVPLGWDGSLTPWLPGYSFEPESLALQDVLVNTPVDFIALERPLGYASLQLVAEGETLPVFAWPGDLVWVGPGLYEGQLEPREGVTYLGAGPDLVTIRSGGDALRMGNGDDQIFVEGFGFEGTAGDAARTFSNNRPVRLRNLRLLATDAGLNIGGANDPDTFDMLIEGLRVEGGRDAVIFRSPEVEGEITMRRLTLRNVTDGLDGSQPDLRLSLELLDARNISGDTTDLALEFFNVRNFLIEGARDGLGILGDTVADVGQATLIGSATAFFSGNGTDATLHDSILFNNIEGIDGSGGVALDHIVYQGGWLFGGPTYDEGDAILQADPLFTDPAAGDYTLLPDSPARGFGSSGQDVGAYGGPLGDQWQAPALTPRPALRRITLLGSRPQQTPGASFSFQPYGLFAGGWVGPIPGLTVWSSSNPSVVGSLGAGQFQALTEGEAILTASAEGQKATVLIQVTDQATSANVAPSQAVEEGPLTGVRRRFAPTALNSLEGGWQQAASMGSPRREQAAVLLTDGRILVTGGISNFALDSTEIFDPTTGKWRPGPPMGQARRGHTATLLGDGRVLVVGETAEIFDPLTNQWSPAAEPTAPHAFHTATLLVDGRVLVVGGSGTSIPEIYDPVRDAWFSTGGDPLRFITHVSVRLADGRVLVVDEEEALIYHPSSGWADAAAPILGVQNATATLLLDGRVLVAGGSRIENQASQVFTPDSGGGSWQLTGAMLDNRISHRSMLLPSGQVLAVGGSDREARAEAWDPATGLWADAGAPSSGRQQHSLAQLPSGQLMLIGGDSSNSPSTARCEVFQPPTPPASSAASLAESRYIPGVARLPDGRILAVGGFHQSYSDGVEIYSPEMDAWVAGQPLATATERQVVSLADGRVLAVAAGYAEIFDPTTGSWRLTAPKPLASPFSAPILGRLADGRILTVSQVGADIYDPETDKWTVAGDMVTPRNRATVTPMPTGEILVAGGELGDRTIIPTVEVYDPVSDAWRSVESLRFPRRRHTAVPLPSGEVLVIGGDDGDLAHATAEIYDPTASRWRFTLGDMAEGRSFAGSIVSDGSVWIIGGEGANRTTLASTEIYDPLTDLWRSGPDLATPRSRYGLARLDGGDILVVGGRTVDRWGLYRSLVSVERLSAQAIDGGRRPMILDAPEVIRFGESFTVEVDTWSGGEGHGGRAGASAYEHPVVELRAADDGRIVRLLPELRRNIGLTPPSWSGIPVELMFSRLPATLDPGPYELIVRRAGLASAPERVVLACSLAITAQPQDVTVALGESATFEVASAGGRTYQWRRDGVDIPDATAPVYTTPAATASDVGAVYDVVVKGGCEETVSQPATLGIADDVAPTGAILDPDLNDCWVLPVVGEPDVTETVVWDLNDDIRLCTTRLWLEASADPSDAESWRPIDRSGVDPAEPLASFGEGPGCAQPVSERSYELRFGPEPPTLDGVADGLEYRFRLEAQDHAGNVGEVLGEAFSIVEPDSEDVKTLILTHRGRLEAAFDVPRVDALMDDLQRLADRPKVDGLVIDVSGDAELNVLYAAWDAAVTPAPLGDAAAHAAANRAANEVLFGDASSVNGEGGVHGVLLRRLRAFRGVEFLVIVGGDNIVPMARLVDGANLLPESAYVDRRRIDPAAMPDDKAYTAVARALAGDTFLSDDPIALRQAVDREALNRSLFLPDLAVGRLVETPEEMRRAIDAFIDIDGNVDFTSDGEVLVTGYDFLVDVASSLEARWTSSLTGVDRVQSLITSGENDPAPWTGADLEGALCLDAAPTVVSFNGHAYHQGEGVPGDDFADIRATDAESLRLACGEGAFDGRILYSAGCHAGLPVPGSASSGGAPLPTDTRDLPQTYLGLGAVAYVANSGYGWGLTGGVGYSERLVQILTEELTTGDGSGIGRAVGQAVAEAKLRYYLETLYYDAYDAKTLMQWTFYGLPMTTLSGGSGGDTEPPPPPVVELRDDMANDGGELPPGIISVRSEIEVSETLYSKRNSAGDAALGPVGEPVEGCPDSDGCYYTLSDLAAARGGGTADLPRVPYLVYDSRLSAARQHGVLWLGGDYVEEDGWRPVIASLVSNDGEETNSGLPQDILLDPIDTHWPDDPGTVAGCRASDLDFATLVVPMAELRPGADGTPYGRHRRYTQVNVEALYLGATSPDVCENEPPVFAEHDGDLHSVVGHTVNWRVPVTDDREVWRVVVVVNDRPADPETGVGRWRPIELVPDSEPGFWRGSEEFPNLSRLRYVVQAVDVHGNVAWADTVGEPERSGGSPDTAPPKMLPEVITVSLESDPVDLSVQLDAVATSVDAGQPFGLTATVSYVPATGAPINALLEISADAGLENLSSGGGPWECDGRPLLCRRLEPFEAGTTETLRISGFTTSDPGAIGTDQHASARIFHGGDDPVPGNDLDGAVIRIDGSGPSIRSVSTVASIPAGAIPPQGQLDIAVSQLLVDFTDSITGATDPLHWRLVASGPDNTLETIDCDGPAGDDWTFTLDAGPVDDARIWLRASDGVLPADHFRLIACPGIEDLSGQPLDAPRVAAEFEVTEHHLLRDPNIDDATLSPWRQDHSGGGVAIGDPRDAGDAQTSGAIRTLVSGDGLVRLSQCMGVSAATPVEVGGRTAVLGGRARLFLEVSTHAAPDCSDPGVVIAGSSQEVSAPGAWLAAEPLIAPTTSGWLRISYAVEAVDGSAVDLLLDDLVARWTEALFADDFESGDTSAWTGEHP
ncbi:MAG: kelch repeat-containing protein [Acidobacteriota bacterium]